MRNTRNSSRGYPKLINGNVTRFVDHVYYGDELLFVYEDCKYFLQGFQEGGKFILYLDRWEPPAEDYIWVGTGNEKDYPVQDFLEAKIWNGKSFWEVEEKIEWVDA